MNLEGVVRPNVVWKKIFEPTPNNVPYFLGRGEVVGMFVDTIGDEDIAVWEAKNTHGKGYFFHLPTKLKKLLEKEYGDTNDLIPFFRIAQDKRWTSLRGWGFFIVNGDLVIEPQEKRDNPEKRYKIVKEVLNNMSIKEGT